MWLAVVPRTIITFPKILNSIHVTKIPGTPVTFWNCAKSPLITSQLGQHELMESLTAEKITSQLECLYYSYTTQPPNLSPTLTGMACIARVSHQAVKHLWKTWTVIRARIFEANEHISTNTSVRSIGSAWTEPGEFLFVLHFQLILIRKESR